MTEKTKNDLALEKWVAKSVIADLINSLHKERFITDKELADRDIVISKVKSYINKNKGNIDWQIIIDHRETIIEYAETAYKKENIELSIALYGTIIEHTLNRIIHLRCFEKKIDGKIQTEIIRNINIIGKCTWLLSLLDLPVLNEVHVKTIMLISEERNSYLHYKWKPEKDTDKVRDYNKEETEEIKKMKAIKSLLKYLKNYETKLEFKGNKSKIKKIVK
jgi:hypothetical protein